MSGASSVLPKECVSWLYDYSAWLVGSGISWFLDGGAAPQPKDLDFVIPPKHWNAVCRTLVGHEVRLNSFGGLKVTLGSFTVDLWPSTIDDFFDVASSYSKPTQALRVKPYLLLKSVAHN